MSVLRWHQFGVFAWSAWSTTDGAFTQHEFQICPTHLGLQLIVRHVQTANEDLCLSFNHAQYTVDDVKATADVLRTALPARAGEPWLSLQEIEQRIGWRRGIPERCRFVHAFPLGATDDTMCRCGRITRGFYNSALARSAS